MDEFVDTALGDGTWSSPDHRHLAVQRCICNPELFNMTELCKIVKVINELPQGRVREITYAELEEVIYGDGK